jgi:hypothetical protein
MQQRVVGRAAWVVGCALVVTLNVYAQTPQPFPRAGQPAQQTPPPRSATPPAAPSAPPTAQPQTQIAAPATAGPTAATLGSPIYPGAQFLTSYEAGRGQRFYIFGTTAPYADIVTYYRTQLSDGGDVVFKEPATHQFNVGRFRQETMAFPPGVTVKDWTWGGSQGYPNPKLGGQPARFPTVIMIVPPPPAAPAAR